MKMQELVFDPEAPEFLRDPHPICRRLREEAPIFRWDQRNALVFSRHEDVRALLSEPRLTNDIRRWEHFHPEALLGDECRALRRLLVESPFRSSGADYLRMRRLASVALTPRAVQLMRGSIQRTVDEMLDRATAGGAEVINVREFAEPIPLNVISDILAVPADRRAQFRKFGRAVLQVSQSYVGPAELPEIAATFSEGEQLLVQLITERRAALGDDLLSDLIRARDEEHQLDEDELLGLVSALIAGGSDTVVHALCYAVRALLEHRAALGEIRADPALLRNAIDETMRWDYFVKLGIVRYPVEDFELLGHPLKKGQLVFGLMPAALRDPAIFADPDRFDIHRQLGHALIFGAGRHHCPGTNLARLELDVAVQTLLFDRYPDAELAGEPEYDRHMLARSMSKLPLRLGRRAG